MTKNVKAWFKKVDNSSRSSNTTFGLFFSMVFAGLSLWFLTLDYSVQSLLISGSIALFFGLSAIFSPNTLEGLNKWWVRLGYILSLVMQPIILGMIFFGLISPIAIVSKICNVDRLRLRPNGFVTNWENSEKIYSADGFKNQF